jgi:hypothetical protein
MQFKLEMQTALTIKSPIFAIKKKTAIASFSSAATSLMNFWVPSCQSKHKRKQHAHECNNTAQTMDTTLLQYYVGLFLTSEYNRTSMPRLKINLFLAFCELAN